MQFHLFRGTVPRRKPSIVQQRLVFPHTGSVVLVLAGIYFNVYADADYATSNGTDRRSMSGGVIVREGACVCWFSRTQKCVTLSKSEQNMLLSATLCKRCCS